MIKRESSFTEIVFIFIRITNLQIDFLFLLISHLYSIQEPLSQHKLIASLQDDCSGIEEVICLDQMDISAPSFQLLMSFSSWI